SVCFNEAAVRDGGSPVGPALPPTPSSSFNEAAVRDGGSRGGRGEDGRARRASMRPPFVTAEVSSWPTCRCASSRFNEAAVRDGGGPPARRGPRPCVRRFNEAAVRDGGSPLEGCSRRR